MDKVNQFFDFEINNNLYDIVDEYGLKPWESVRYEVMLRVLHNSFSSISKHDRPSIPVRLWNVLCRLTRWSFYTLSHPKKDNLFYLCSRDKINGILYDKISDKLYNIVDRNNCFSVESMGSYLQPNYKYGSGVTPDMTAFFAKYTKYYYDFSEIYNLIKSTFPECTITIDVMNACYRQFVTEYKYYKVLFRWCQTKRVFVVQNGIRKGLFAAANELGIKLIELQHGQISVNHPAYSYPSECLIPASKIYHPDILLTFGSFWSKNRNYPGVKDLVIGNDSYADSIEMPDTHGNKKLLVISNHLEGELLAKRVKEVLARDPEFYFFFKLHPDQYMDYELYKACFEGFDRVEVVSNQFTINQLLSQCEGLFLNDSTVELEALRVGRKVYVLTEQYYLVMDFVLGEPGIYACKDIDEFLEKYECHKNERLSPRDDLFSIFNSELAEEILEC